MLRSTRSAETVIRRGGFIEAKYAYEVQEMQRHVIRVLLRHDVVAHVLLARPHVVLAGVAPERRTDIRLQVYAVLL